MSFALHLKISNFKVLTSIQIIQYVLYMKIFLDIKFYILLESFTNFLDLD